MPRSFLIVKRSLPLDALARDLHDSIKQQIFAMQTSAATAEARFQSDPQGARQAIAQVRDSARESMAEMDAMLDQLRTPAIENTSLIEALKKQCEALEFRTGAQVHFTMDALPPSEALPPGAHQAMVRIAQEALANVARHARARHVSVAVSSTSDRVELRISDDGQGYAADGVRRGMGLDNMRTRAAALNGDIEIASALGSGTTSTAWIPLMADDPGVYLRKALWSGLAALLFGLFGTQSSGLSLLPLGILFAFDAIRYLNAWRRARTFRVGAA